MPKSGSSGMSRGRRGKYKHISEPKSIGALQVIVPWGWCKPHYVVIYGECSVGVTSKMKENNKILTLHSRRKQ